MKDELTSIYINDLELYQNMYELMGVMLDKTYVVKRLEEKKIDKIYIYGGGYLGIQFYNSVKDFITVLAIVDKSGGLKFSVDNVETVSIEEFRNRYNGEVVVITPIQFGEKIYEEIIQFVENERIYFIGEII